MSKKEEKCFWCDTNNPKVIQDYMPCERCIIIITSGIVLIEVQDIPMQLDQPTLVIPNNYPTGSWFIIKPVAASRLFNKKNLEKILRDRIAFLDRGMLENLGFKPSEEIIHPIQ